MPVPLPSKENTLFKKVLKCYEQKHFKNGLKYCKQILSNPKCAEHGETLAMKGLIINYLGRKEEAMEYVKKGLKNDLQSHVCWHVYGMLQRSEGKYEEAVKCYRNALKWDKDNLQILRDLSLLQVQMRDIEGFRDTKYQLLKLRPTVRQSWMGYAVSQHLLQNYDAAFQVLEEFRRTSTETSPKPFDQECSESALYQVMILREGGRTREALDHLELCENQITDKVLLKEWKAELYFKLGDISTAERLYRELIRRNPENKVFYSKIEECLQPETVQDRLAIYRYFQKLYKRAITPQIVPLHFLSGSEFKQYVSRYIHGAFVRSLPNLFNSIRGLYNDQKKVECIEQVVLSELEALQVASPESQATLLWVYFFLAQHYDHLQKYEMALEYANMAIRHTPTLIEAYIIMAKIYKHAQNTRQAAFWMNEARNLDTADRYINSRCAKYQLQDNQIEQADKTCSLFTKANVGVRDDLNEMQCMWYQTECAAAYMRLGQPGEALKKCFEVENHFRDVVEDQFDFHTYCMRKVTLGPYIRMLRLEDTIRQHQFFVKAAKLAIEVYTSLHDFPMSERLKASAIDESNLSPSELKKLRSKQRKAEKRALKQTEEEQKNCKSTEKQESKVVINANTLVSTTTPLEDAGKFLLPLLQYSSDDVVTHLLAFEVYRRKAKLLLMLRAVKNARRLQPDHPMLHEKVVALCQTVQQSSITHEVVAGFIRREVFEILQTDNLVEYNRRYMEKNPCSLLGTWSGLAARCVLDPGQREESLQLLMEKLSSFEPLRAEDCREILRILSSPRSDGLQLDAAKLESFRLFCKGRFPLASCFGGTEENRPASTDEEPQRNGPAAASPDISRATAVIAGI